MKKLIGYMNFGIKHVLNLIMGLLVTVVFLQVIFRFILNSPLAWTEELARYSLIWLTFLGAAYAMSSKAHIGMEFFVKLFAAPVRQALYSIATFASLLFFLLMVIEGYDLSMQGMSQTSPVLRIPMGMIYMIIPVSGIILLINMASQFSKDFKSGGV
ncbi:tripartite AtP-independent periplasmic transporter subunit DctQ [Planococcus antarcticus DSM 14505]|uniref:C4-dicarboxylate ABC transporter permease n=1 Tax=Planococcus antarcticus DSM 14505 TaxID=1185653 RepID=A0A1C7DK17_9BACL|nr:TRAP transporter small permease [Planococcus antarcticus]ANU11767.1 C4-dicarboxylate ABC transporter permease [Planococcus antarcticus DSM 14505]EIM06375.1 tripartite AtP-independent periplasmic transporter subunit DctQ [Planococcus antarcticus DSM 14505]